MELNERETLVRVEQQLKDSVQNQNQIMADLKEIFQRIEGEAKLITTISGDLKGHLDNSTIRWDNLERRLTSLDKEFNDLEKKADDNTRDISETKKEQEKFVENVKSSARATKWIIGIMAALASILGSLSFLLEILDRIKG